MKNDEIDRILDRAANRDLPQGAGRAAMARIQSALLTDLRPVRPLAPLWAFTLAFVSLFVAFAVASASTLGLHGIRVLSLGQRWSIFSLLLATGWLAAVSSARAMRPAAGALLGWLALVSAAGVFPVLFALVFRGYSTLNFAREGVPCLVAGLCVAIPTGLATVWILRRGFVLDWSGSGLGAGVLSGLTGLCMLELHCPNLKAIHVMVWHVAVVVVSGMMGWAVGWVAEHFRRGRPEGNTRG
jgi:hypothetical protein